MKKVLFSFVLACSAVVAANAQSFSTTPIKIFDDGNPHFSHFFTYENGDQVFLLYGEDKVEIYNLSFNRTKTVNFSTVAGYKYPAILWNEFFYSGYSFAASDKLTDDNLLGFIVLTTDGFAIINENGVEKFRKRNRLL